ncbi:hypothetical protein GQ473_00380 [archaeon]|nr:hypothetical protein [archaeon]
MTDTMDLLTINTCDLNELKVDLDGDFYMSISDRVGFVTDFIELVDKYRI